MSGSAAVSNLEGFEYVTVNAFHQAAVNYVGQNAGARQFDRVRRILQLCLVYAAVAAVLICTAFYVFAPNLLSLYIPDSPEAIAIGVSRMVYTTLPYFLFGLMDVTTGALRGFGASFISMIISILGICGVRIAWIYTAFRMVHTPNCLFIGYPVSWIITLVAQMAVFVFVYRKALRENAD